MPRAARIAIYMLAFLAVLLFALTLYVRSNNYSPLRDLITARVERATGQQLSFNGPISLEMGADSFLRFQDVVLTNPDWQFFRSTITVDEGRIGLDIPNVVAGGIGTVVELGTVRVELERPEEAKTIAAAPPPGTPLAAPNTPPLPEFDELKAERLIFMARNFLGDQALDLKDLTVTPDSQTRTRLTARASGQSDIDLSFTTDEIDGGRAWEFSVLSPRTELSGVFEATVGRKLALRGAANGRAVDVADLSALLKRIESKSTGEAQAKELLQTNQDLPIGWLQLISATLDIRISDLKYGQWQAQNVALDGRADNGWISFAPLRASAGPGQLRGFLVLDASSLPARLDLSLTGQDLQPEEGGQVLDVKLNGQASGRNIQALRALTGDIRAYASGLSLPTARFRPALDPALDVLSAAETLEILCGAIEMPLVDGRSDRARGQVFTQEGRMALRGSMGLGRAPLDLEVSAQSSAARADALTLDVVGAFSAPAVMRQPRAAPWLNAGKAGQATCQKLRADYAEPRTGR